jgi:hypothetical protein
VKWFALARPKWREEYSRIFGCQSGTYPFKYLGIPMHHKKLSSNGWKIIEQRIEKKLSSWKGKSICGRSNSLGELCPNKPGNIYAVVL